MAACGRCGWRSSWGLEGAGAGTFVGAEDGVEEAEEVEEAEGGEQA